MVNNLKCPVKSRSRFTKEELDPQSIGLSAQTDEEKLKSLEGREYISLMTFRASVKSFGFFRVLKSYIVRWRYMLGLWCIRESVLIRTLSQNFEKVPAKTFSKLIARPQISSLCVILLDFVTEKICHLKGMKNRSVLLKTGNNQIS